jgi:magnesium-transporting ATPase (P-type)
MFSCEAQGPMNVIMMNEEIKDTDRPSNQNARSSRPYSTAVESPHTSATTALHPQNNWRTYIVSFTFITYIMLFLALSVFYLSATPSPVVTVVYSSTTFVLNIMYTFFLLVTIFTSLLYVLRGRSDTTIIPCIQSTWYKAYTLLLLAMATTTFILACFETVKRDNGPYTTAPPR